MKISANPSHPYFHPICRYVRLRDCETDKKIDRCVTLDTERGYYDVFGYAVFSDNLILHRIWRHPDITFLPDTPLDLLVDYHTRHKHLSA